MRFEAAVPDLGALIDRLPDQARRHRVAMAVLTRLAVMVEGEAKRRAPRRTGTLSREILHHADDQAGEVTILADTRYAEFVERGTGMFGPYHRRIYPLRARALRWPVGAGGPGGSELRLTGTHRSATVRSGAAQWAFARSTAGAKPRPFFRPAWEAVRLQVPAVIRKAESQLFGGGQGAP